MKRPTTPQRVPRFGRRLAFLAATLSAATLAACSAPAQDPFQREGTWHATGVNEANLRAMLANPADLSRGAAAPVPTRGDEAATAVRQFLNGTRPALPAVRASSIGAPPSTAAPVAGMPTAQGGADALR